MPEHLSVTVPFSGVLPYFGIECDVCAMSSLLTVAVPLSAVLFCSFAV